MRDCARMINEVLEYLESLLGLNLDPRPDPCICPEQSVLWQAHGSSKEHLIQTRLSERFLQKSSQCDELDMHAYAELDMHAHAAAFSHENNYKTTTRER